jgi:hexosaminidase
MPNFEKVEYMAYNRMIAMSEVLWTSKAKKPDYEKFKLRFSSHLSYWKSKGKNVANHLLNVNPKVHNDANSGSYLEYASTPKTYSKHQDQENYQQNDKIILDQPGKYLLYASDGQNKGPEVSLDFQPHLATKAKMDMETEPSKKYYGNGLRSIINGVKGSNQKYGGNEWLGFDGDDCNFTLTFDKKEIINAIEFRFFNAEKQWIYLPSKVEIRTGDSILQTITNFERTKISELSLSLDGIECNSLNIKISNFGPIPEGSEGAGHNAWLFVDEVIVR